MNPMGIHGMCMKALFIKMVKEYMKDLQINTEQQQQNVL
jgi:hypothetical protein